MSNMGDRIGISIQSNVAAGTVERLQKQLDAVGKRLILRIGKVKVDNQQFNKSVKSAADSYAKQMQNATLKVEGTQKKSVKSYEQWWEKALKNQEWQQEKNAKKYEQWWLKALKTREIAESKLVQKQMSDMDKLQAKQRASQGYKYNDAADKYKQFWDKALDQREIKDRQVAEKQEQRQRKLTLSYEQFWLKALKTRENAEIATQNKIEQVERNRINRLNSTGSSSRVTLYDQTRASQVQSGLANRLSTQQNTLSGIAQTPANANQIRSLTQEMNKLAESSKKVTNSGMLRQWNTELGNTKTKITALKNETNAAAKASKGFTHEIGHNLSKIATWAVSGTIFFGALRQFKQGIQTLIEIDTQLVDIAKVTNYTAEEMKNLATQASIVGKELGRTAQEYLSATAGFARAGLGKASEELAKTALLFANVGDLDINQAQETLIATIQGMNMEYSESIKIVDSLNIVSNNNATTVNKMSDGLKNFAATAKMANLDLDQTIALLGTATAVTQKSGSEVKIAS